MSEEINKNWCIENGFTHQTINVVDYDSYYYECKGKYIIGFSKGIRCTCTLYVENFDSKKSLGFEKKLRSSSEIGVTVSDLKRMCELADIEYPF